LSKITIHSANAGCRTDSSKEIDIELDWIGGLRDQVEFANEAMKHHCILFKVQRRKFVAGDMT
jgi:hypothetical protein